MKYDIRQIEEFAERLPPDVRRHMFEEDIRHTKEEHDCFVKAYGQDKCYLCGNALDQVNPRELCLHWLLLPKGIRSRDIARVLGKFGYFRTQTFLRWLANQEGVARNINDLEEERDPSKLLEATIRYRDYEWTFTCAQSDLEGHKTSDQAEVPHFHFQMKKDEQLVFAFNDLHCPFTDEDLFKVEIIRSDSTKIKHRFIRGEGMNDLLSPEIAETIIQHAKTPKTPDQAAVRIRTMVMAKDGENISEDEINAIIREAREKDISFASLIRRLEGRAEIKTVILPAETVPEMAHRNKSRGKNKKQQ